VSIDQSESLKRLTVLAVIFLPLSLSSSLLAMSTRFANLHLLLYDFLGVFVLLSSIALLIFITVGIGIKLAASIRSRKWRKNPREQFDTSRRRREHLYFWLKSVCAYGVILVAWALLLASFLIGMLKDVLLGVKIRVTFA
jgi:hypothetical protein